MLGIGNPRLRSVPEYRHQFARSLAGIVHHRGHGERREKQMK